MRNKVLSFIEYNDMQVKILRLLPLLAALMMTGCSSDEGEDDQVSIPTYDFYIRFLSPSGTNILDSLDVCAGQELHVTAGDEDIILTCISSWKEQPVNKLGLAWWTIPKNYHWHNQEEVLPEGTVLDFHWADNLYHSRYRPNYLEVEYLITLISPKIFKDNEGHTIKWFVKILGNRYDAYKCEVEGKNYSLVDDPIYNYWSPSWKPELFAPFTESESSRIHFIGGVITINVEK